MDQWVHNIMKHIEYNKLDIDPFNEDDWDEVEP